MVSKIIDKNKERSSEDVEREELQKAAEEKAKADEEKDNNAERFIVRFDGLDPQKVEDAGLFLPGVERLVTRAQMEKVKGVSNSNFVILQVKNVVRA